MKKRILSLLCVLALCLGLLPTTALAAGEIELYVGETQITGSGYWTTDPNGKLAASDENNYNVYYDGNGTLTLNNATIQGRGIMNVGDPIDYGIYAASTSGQSVALTINLIGTNTVKGAGGIYITSGGNSTLVIQSDTNGSLETSGSGWDGITISSNSGNVSLTINNASVKASTESNNYHGVCIIGRDASNPILSLTVNGGSLTAKGGSGIFYYLESSANPSTSLMVSDGALIKAIPNIRVYGASKPTPQGTGIVFDGNSGTVYGNVTLDKPLTVVAGETLTIPQGSTLNGNSNLTNDGTVTIQEGGTLTGGDAINNTGTINVEDGGKLDGTPTGTVVYAPTITTQPVGQTVTVGQTAEFTVAATGENLSYQWQYSNDNGTNWNDITGATGSSYTTDAVTLEMNNYQYQCVVSNSAGSVTSDPVTLTVNSVPVTGVKLDTDKLDLFTGESKTLTATVEPANATNQDVTWSSDKPEVATVVDGTVTAVKAGEATITVKTVDGGYTATCTVKVTDKTYTITVDPAKLDFDAAYLGYNTQPAPQTVTITNTGNQTLNLDPPASTTSFEVGTLSKTQLTPNEKATFTVQPKAGLAVGSYKESINISGFNGNHTVSTSVEATFAVVDSNDTSVNNKLTVTSGISDNITYYTCPSCGYHNWTATDAGYRCDNCGYLESTRQLSGYGNVKGTYTPGSGATSTAVSAVPQTGDESNPVLWTVLLLVSGLALGGLAIAKRKKQQ